jgi:hypothetical protein
MAENPPSEDFCSLTAKRKRLAFLAADESRWITGGTIRADGGSKLQARNSAHERGPGSVANNGAACQARSAFVADAS